VSGAWKKLKMTGFRCQVSGKKGTLSTLIADGAERYRLRRINS
jgi:hypothetical protein